MPGVEYLDNSSWQDDNLFYDPMQLIGLDLGLSLGSLAVRRRSSALRTKYRGYMSSLEERLGGNVEKKAKVAKRIQMSRRGAGMYYDIENPRHVDRIVKRYSTALSLRKESRASFKYAKNLRRMGKIFGAAGLAHFGFAMGSSITGLGESFRVAERERVSSAYGGVEEPFFDSRAAFTQRQRALQVIHNSRLSLKPALGGEAQYMHY